jgi:hypothetical protein
MRLSKYTKVSIPVSLLSIVSIISAFILSGVSFRGTPTHAAAAQNHSVIATKGTITRAGTVDLSKQPPAPAQASHASAHSRIKGERLFKIRSHAGVNQAAHTPTAAASAFAKSDQHPRPVFTNFNGVSSLDSAVTNFGAEFEPPDQGLCVGNGFVVEPVNSAFTIYRHDGSVVAGPFNVNVLFNEDLLAFTSDPRCYFDISTHTWFAIILFIDFNPDHPNAHTDLAVNTSGDPTSTWTVYHIDNTDNGTNGTPSNPGCPCFGDQPLLGIDPFNIYISTNEFSIFGPEFNGAQIYAISKLDLLALSPAVHFVHFGNLSIGGSIATSVQPAITNGFANAEYFLNSLDPNGTFDNRLGVWAITDQDAVRRGDVPPLSSVVITSETYGVPPNAIQKGASSLLTSDDDRMQQVQFINGELWGALDTVLTIPDDTAPRAGAAWFKVRPHLLDGVIGSADLENQGYVASLGNYLLYPAIEVNRLGTAAMVMTLSGPNFFPSAAYTVLRPGDTSFGAIHIAADGTGPYDPTATRWGDYSAAATDVFGTFWMATEYIPPVSSQTTDRLTNWGTRVFKLAALP